MELRVSSHSLFGAAVGAGLLLAIALLAPAAHAQRNPAAQVEKVQLRIRLVLPDSKPGTQRGTTLLIQPLDPTQPGADTAPGSAKVTEGTTTTVMLPPGSYQITSIDPVMTGSHSSRWDIELAVTSSPTDLELSQQNASRATPFGEAGGSEPVRSSSNNAPPASADIQQQIEAVLDRWVESLKARDLEAQMTCYAPQLSRYFLKQNVSAEQVRRDKERFLERYPEIRNLELHDIQITSSDGRPSVRAVKSWSFGGQRNWSGEVVTHLGFERENGRWVIVSERESLIDQMGSFAQGSAALRKAAH